jgi:N utilization substance protein A
MNGEDLIRYVDVIHRDRDIPKEVIFRGLEDALSQGVRKRLGVDEDLVVTIDRKSGDVHMEDEEEVYELDLDQLGRIVAQAVKQGFLQRVREAERDVLYEEYEARVGQLVNGQVQRFEGESLVVNLGKVEAYLSRDDRVRGENFAPGDRIRCLIVEVRKEGSRVKIFVSRTHPDLVRSLFQLEVPEVSDGIIEVRRVVREPGYRTKMAVVSSDPKIDCIGACVGVRGSRIKAVIDELRGERIDIIRWSDSLEQLIMNGLKPAVIHLDNIFPDVENHRAIVIVDEDQQSLAIGKRGQNVRLASKLCGWDIEIKTRTEFDGGEGEEGDGEGAELTETDAPEAGANDLVTESPADAAAEETTEAVEPETEEAPVAEAAETEEAPAEEEEPAVETEEAPAEEEEPAVETEEAKEDPVADEPGEDSHDEAGSEPSEPMDEDEEAPTDAAEKEATTEG